MNRERVTELVNHPNLQDLTVVVMAKRDFANGRYDDGMYRLSVDNDKIRMDCPELAALVQEWFEGDRQNRVRTRQ